MSIVAFYRNAKANLNKTSLADFLYLVLLSVMTICFIAVGHDGSTAIDRYGIWLAVFLMIVVGVFILWVFLMSIFPDTPTALQYARIILSPILIFPIIIPFNYFYPLARGTMPLGGLAVICVGMVIFCLIIKRSDIKDANHNLLNWKLLTTVIIYAVIFSWIACFRYLNVINIRAFDIALYNQIQWNNLHGNFFQSSAAGSNFVTHNSPFLILLTPFYAVYPHPATLLVLKSLFLALSALPLYLILRRVVHRKSIFPLILMFLFNPYIVGQHFNAPHEMCFLPPFLLFSFYFFLIGRFRWFILFLFISLSVKEHMSLMAVMYGVIAFFQKKEKHWVIVPIISGIVWGIFSMWIIYQFQRFYSVDPHPAWLIENIKMRFIYSGSDVASSLRWGIETSNLGSASKFVFIYSLFSPVALIIPFLSPVILLGLPEFAINLMASIPLFFVEWHYNIVVVSFVMLAAIMAVKKVSSFRFNLKTTIKPAQKETLLAWFLCLCTISHFFLWWDLTIVRSNPSRARTIAMAIEKIPDDASVSAPKHLVPYVSSRRNYFLLDDKRKGEYIIINRGPGFKSHFSDKDQADYYKEIFRKGRVIVYKKSQQIY